MAGLVEGAKAPEFALPAGDGTTLALSDLRGKKVVLYFYPKDDTPGCTREACSFQEHLGPVKRKGALVLGVSPDPPASHAKFSGKYGLSFPLLSDQDRSVAKLYGVWKKKSLYGRTYMGVERTTFIIDERGMIARIFPKVKVDGHTTEVLNSL
jgi:thioredoxin-dependent peroxiredoxin